MSYFTIISFVLQKSGIEHISFWTSLISSAQETYAAGDSHIGQWRPGFRAWKPCLHTGPGLCCAVTDGQVLVLEPLSLFSLSVAYVNGVVFRYALSSDSWFLLFELKHLLIEKFKSSEVCVGTGIQRNKETRDCLSDLVRDCDSLDYCSTNTCFFFSHHGWSVITCLVGVRLGHVICFAWWEISGCDVSKGLGCNGGLPGSIYHRKICCSQSVSLRWLRSMWNNLKTQLSPS